MLLALIIVFKLAIAHYSPKAPPLAAPAPVATATVPTRAQAFQTWHDGGGGERLEAIVGDFQSVGKAAGVDDMVALNSACSSFQTDVEAAQAYAPVPDDQTQIHWAAALAQDARASADCIAGSSAGDLALLSRAADEMSAGKGQIDMATARIKDLQN